MRIRIVGVMGRRQSPTMLDLAAIAPVVAVAGNHDNPRRFAALEPLLSLGRISIGSGLRRPEDGGVIAVPGIDCRVALVPWTSQRGIVKADDLMHLDPDDHGLQYAGRMERIVAALCGSMSASTVNAVSTSPVNVTVNVAVPASSSTATSSIDNVALLLSLIVPKIGRASCRERV